MGTFKDVPALEAKWLIEDSADGKKEKQYIVEMTLLKEGWGNQANNNYYQKKAVESVVPLAMARKKMFISHPEFGSGEVKPTDRSIMEWAATIQEAWVDTSFQDGKSRARAKVKIHHPYLRQLAEEAPDELVCSIEGRGHAQAGKVDGKKCNTIEEVKWINAFNWVDYGGNADMGINMIEKDMGVDNMDIQTVEQLKVQFPALVVELEKAITDKVKKEVSDKDVVEDLKMQLSAREKVIIDNQKELSLKEGQIDAFTAKEDLRLETEQKAKEAEDVKSLVETAIKEATLPEALVSDFWKNRLYSLRPIKKEDGTVVTLEEQIKVEIEDRKLLALKADPATVKNMGDEKNVSTKEMEARAPLWGNIFSAPKKEDDKDK